MSVLCQYIEAYLYTNLLILKDLYQTICRMSVDLKKMAGSDFILAVS